MRINQGVNEQTTAMKYVMIFDQMWSYKRLDDNSLTDFKCIIGVHIKLTWYLKDHLKPSDKQFETSIWKIVLSNLVAVVKPTLACIKYAKKLATNIRMIFSSSFVYVLKLLLCIDKYNTFVGRKKNTVSFTFTIAPRIIIFSIILYTLLQNILFLSSLTISK